MVFGIIIAAIVVGATGLILGLFLCVSSEKFKVEVDERETAIMGVLPGNNCGGCGYAGCSGLAAAIVKGEAPCNQCPVGGDGVGQLISEIMGVEAGESVKMVAFVKCSGDCEKANSDYNYFGVQDCKAMAYVPGGGPKSCNYGCLGYGSCVKACPFDAIHVVNGIAKVDKEACKACGKCVAVCPHDIIDLVPYEATYLVECNSQDKGKTVMDVCASGCIGCKLCEKNCEAEAIHVENNIAFIDQSKCTACGTCAEKCPKKVIKKVR